MSLLISQHPVKFATEKPIHSAQKPKYANVVLLDVTGWDQFPVLRFKKQFRDNPCHFIDARFIVLVTRSCFLEDRSTIVQFFDDQGIVNYAIIPTPSSALERVDNISIYTENRFSKEQIFVQLNDLDNMHRLFPNKLIDLYGYHIRIGVKQTDLPYMVIRRKTNDFFGTLNYIFKNIGTNILNLTFTFFTQDTKIYDGDAYYSITFQRDHFQHEVAFRDMGGMCLLCPVRQDKYFLLHLFKPFSFGAWIFLGGVLVVCCILRLLFPSIFRYDPILQAVFGVIGNEYNQAFPARAVLFGLSWLSFFFSRTCIGRIMALMSLGQFSKRPRTIAEFMQSDYMMAIQKDERAHFPLDDFISKILDQHEFEQLRGKIGMNYRLQYCSLEPCGLAYFLTVRHIHKFSLDFFVIKESIVPYPRTLQFATNSPIVTVISRYLGLFYETGLWNIIYKMHTDILEMEPESRNTISEVVFSFDDLVSVWILLGGGLLISTVLFLGELISKKRM
ncbi:uncharacterized protein LOC128302825 [Anopheles moucheti]|uniref:uncharacterized protein LOC128302825 n=1 Tax=Anopheles moucheti TaxID=186751 RepID=UPI0022F069B2|nr:uncharacterized protein LOC128302825 [Anopheles moucheti]